jgi:hypothetical protein
MPIKIKRLPAVEAASVGMFGLFAFALAPAAAQATTFTFTGGEEAYVVPAGVTEVAIDAIGARGGTGCQGENPAPLPGALGGESAADYSVRPGSVLYVEVGGPGTDGGACPNATQAGGFTGAVPAVPWAAGAVAAHRMCAPCPGLTLRRLVRACWLPEAAADRLGAPAATQAVRGATGAAAVPAVAREPFRLVVPPVPPAGRAARPLAGLEPAERVLRSPRTMEEGEEAAATGAVAQGVPPARSNWSPARRPLERSPERDTSARSP